MGNCLGALETVPDTLERTWDVEGITVLRARVTVPEPGGNDRVSRRIRRFYQLQRRSYLRYCDKFLFPLARAEYEAAVASSAPLKCFSAELKYCVTYNEGGLWSLYTLSREVTNDILLVRRGDTWDLAEGCPVPMTRFFRRRVAWKRELVRFAAAEMERRERCGAARWQENWRVRLRRAFNPRDYYLTEEGLAFFLPMYTVGGIAEGTPTFTLPWSAGVRPAAPEGT